MKTENAVFTMWQNDLVILNLWIKYYIKHFDRLYIFCFNTKDQYWEELEKIKNKHNPKVIFEKLEKFGEDYVGDSHIDMFFIRTKQNVLLKDYNWVLFANCDEIIASPNLKKLMSDTNELLIPCEGYEVIQIRKEKPIDYSKPYFKQREYWVKNINYNKILFSKVPLVWNEGLHQIEGVTEDQSKEFKDTGLYLIHLKHADLQREGDFGPKVSSLDPNIIDHWRKNKKRIPEWVKKLL